MSKNNLRLTNQLNKDICAKVANEFNIPYKVIETIYILYWRQIREIIESMPIEKIENDEVEEGFKKSISISNIGKFFTDKELITVKKFYRDKRRRENEENSFDEG